MDKPPQLTPAEAYEAIQKLLAEGDVLGFTRHASDMMRERNVYVDDVRKVLLNGTVAPDARWSEKSKTWSYTVCGRDCENEPLVIAVAIQPSICRLTLITVKDKSK